MNRLTFISGTVRRSILIVIVLSLTPFLVSPNQHTLAGISNESTSVPIPAFQELPPDRNQIISSSDAQERSQALIEKRVQDGTIPDWQGAVSDTVEAHYDLAGAISAYVVTVTSSTGDTVGYIVVSAPLMSNPILEYAEGQPPYVSELEPARALAEDVDSALIEERPLYLGALTHAYELTTMNATKERQIIDLGTRTVMPVTPDMVPSEVTQNTVPLPPTPRTQSITTQSTNSISGVPDLKQFYTSYSRRSCLVGCIPSAFSNVLVYWNSNGYSNLLTGMSQADLARELGNRMETRCGDNGYGWTSVGDGTAAVHKFANERNYTFRTNLVPPQRATFQAYRNEIDQGRPLVVHILSSRHTVTGVGYNGQYMILHENLWPEASGKRYVQHHAGLELWYDTVEPLAPIGVGEGSGRQETFHQAYEATKSGTSTNLNYGVPTDRVYWYHLSDGSAVTRQNFSNDVALIHDEAADWAGEPGHSQALFLVPAYPISGAIKQYWENNTWLGAPTSSPFRNAVGQIEQHFRNGYVLSSGTYATTGSSSWPTEQDCTRSGLWYLQATNLLDLPNTAWPPPENLSAGSSSVVCADMNQRAEYPLYYAPGHKAAIENQGVWNDRWIAQVSGKIQSLPSSNYWPVSLACDDGCAVEITDNNWLRRMGRWQDQPAMHLGSTFVRNNDSVNIRWYENRGEAAIWLKQGQQALTLPPLAMECDMSVSLADGAPVTNNETVSLALDAPDAVEMRVGFHENLSDVSWQPFSASSEWTLAPANDVMEQTIYAQFRDQEGALLCDGTVVADSIVVDRLPPEGQATLERTDTFTYIFQLDAHDQDSGSGVKDVAILPEALAYLITEDDGANATIWQSYSNEITLPILMTSETQGQTTYQVWFRDAAGNISEPITIEGDSPDENKADGRLYLPLITR